MCIRGPMEHAKSKDRIKLPGTKWQLKKVRLQQMQPRMSAEIPLAGINRGRVINCDHIGTTGQGDLGKPTSTTADLQDPLVTKTLRGPAGHLEKSLAGIIRPAGTVEEGRTEIGPQLPERIRIIRDRREARNPIDNWEPGYAFPAVEPACEDVLCRAFLNLQAEPIAATRTTQTVIESGVHHSWPADLHYDSPHQPAKTAARATRVVIQRRKSSKSKRRLSLRVQANRPAASRNSKKRCRRWDSNPHDIAITGF